MQAKNLRFVGLLLYIVTSCVYAAYTAPPPSLGDVANNMLSPLGVITHTLYNICYILGGGLLVAAAIQYRDHRRNPLQVPLSRPIFLFIVGFILVALPFITTLSESASVVAKN